MADYCEIYDDCKNKSGPKCVLSMNLCEVEDYCLNNNDCSVQNGDSGDGCSNNKQCVQCVDNTTCGENYLCSSNECQIKDDHCKISDVTKCTNNSSVWKVNQPNETGDCVECIAASDCGEGYSCNNNSCQLNSGSCTTTDKSQCPSDKPACNIPANNDTGTCVECNENTDCERYEQCVDNDCQLNSGSCNVNSDCTGSTPICDTTKHSCVQCTAASDCFGNTPICDTTNQKCVECTSNNTSEYDATTRYCSNNNSV